MLLSDVAVDTELGLLAVVGVLLLVDSVLSVLIEEALDSVEAVVIYSS